MSLYKLVEKKKYLQPQRHCTYVFNTFYSICIKVKLSIKELKRSFTTMIKYTCVGQKFLRPKWNIKG